MNGQILTTEHASALVFIQQNSLKAVVAALPTCEVQVGSDGKPGAPPPETDEAVYESLVSHAGTGVVLNSDGGQGGDGKGDAPSNSPYARAARRISEEKHKMFHVGINHTGKQFSRFSVIEVPDNTEGFENVPRSAATNQQRIRIHVTTNHAEIYNKYLKAQIPSRLSLKDYEANPNLWLMNAAWRCRIIGDPLDALGKLLAGEHEQDEPDAEAAAFLEEAGSSSSNDNDEDDEIDDMP